MSMRKTRLLAPLMALFLLTVSAAALDVAEKPISNGGYTHYVIDSDGTLWAWGDSFHGGITAQEDPVPWENAVPEVKNAACADSGFLTGYAVDRDGVLWGWGGDFQGKLMGQDAAQGAVRLMDHVVSVCDMTESGMALKDDGTLWIWGGFDSETKGFREPEQVLDCVRTFCGEWAVLEDGTLMKLWYNGGDGLGPEHVPVAVNVADVRIDDEDVLILGENGALYRASGNSGDWYDPPELLWEDVIGFSRNTAVTADGTLWAWGDDRPAILKDGAPNPEDSYEDLSDEDLAIPVKITEGVRYAEASEDCTLAVMEDGSLWELPSAYHVSIQEGYPSDRFPEAQKECRKLLDQAAPVRMFAGDPNAPAPVLLAAPGQEEEPIAEPEVPAEAALLEGPEAETPVGTASPKREAPAWAALVSLLPLVAAAAYHACKNRRMHRKDG